MKKIGIVVRTARETKGWSQERLALSVGVSQQTIAKIEADAISRTRHLPRIAQSLGLPIGVLDPDFDPHLPPAPLEKGLPIYAVMPGIQKGEYLMGQQAMYHMHMPEPLFDIEEAFGLQINDDFKFDLIKSGDLLLCGSDGDKGINRYSIYCNKDLYDGYRRIRVTGASISLGDGKVVLERLDISGGDIVPEDNWPIRYRLFGVWLN